MKKLLAIGVWFCLFIFMLVAALFWMPDSWRVHATLEIPKIVFIKAPQPKAKSPTPWSAAIAAYIYAKDIPVTNPSICIVGDSAAALAPWPYAKIALPGETCLELPEAIARYAGAPDTFIILTGTWLLHEKRADEIRPRINDIVDSINLHFPETQVFEIPHSGYLAIANNHTIDGGWHLDSEGYRILYARYAFMFDP